MPFESESMSAMPIMPMLPAKAVSMVRPFFVLRLLNLLRLEVVEGEAERRREGHAGLLLAAVLPGLLRAVGAVGHGVARNFAVQEADYARGVALRELRVVRDHYDELIPGYLLQELHYLHARLRVERARGLVGEEDIRVVYERAGYGDALHLAAGHLVGLLVYLVAEADALEDPYGPLAPLRLVDARNCQRELDVREHALVRDEVVGLEYEAYRVVAVGVPVAVLILLRGAAVYHEVALGVLVEAADDVQQRRLAAAARPQYGDELVLPEAYRDAAQGVDGHVPRGVVLAYVL